MTLVPESSREQKHTGDASGNSKNQTGKPDDKASSTVAEPQMPPSNPDPHHGEHQKKHWVDYAAFGVEVIGLIILCIYAAYTIKIYCANKEAAVAATSAANTAAKTLELDRPYVSIDLQPISDLGFNSERMAYVRLGSTAINYGRTPALNAKIWVQFLNQAKGAAPADSDPAAFCKSLEDDPKKGPGFLRETYFPQVPYRQSWIGEVQPDIIGNGKMGLFRPIVMGCVAYKSPFSPDWLYTGRLYYVVRLNHQDMGGALSLISGQPVAQKDLILEPAMIPEISK